MHSTNMLSRTETGCVPNNNIYVKRVPMKYKAATDSENSKHAHQQHTIKNKEKLCPKKTQLKLDKDVRKVHTEHKAVTDSEDSECSSVIMVNAFHCTHHLKNTLLIVNLHTVKIKWNNHSPLACHNQMRKYKTHTSCRRKDGKCRSLS